MENFTADVAEWLANAATYVLRMMVLPVMGKKVRSKDSVPEAVVGWKEQENFANTSRKIQFGM